MGIKQWLSSLMEENKQAPTTEHKPSRDSHWHTPTGVEIRSRMAVSNPVLAAQLEQDINRRNQEQES